MTARRQPLDATLRNVRAANAKLAALTPRVRKLERDVAKILKTCRRFLDIYGYT